MVYDIAIIGSSVAGSTLCLALATEGLNIALIDERNFPRRKTCGEGLSILGCKVLQKYLGSNWLDYIPSDPFYNYNIYSNKYHFKIGDKEYCNPRGFGISRLTLDNLLVTNATKFSNVHFFNDEKVLDVQQNTSKCRIILNNGSKIDSKYCVIGVGKNLSLLNKLSTKIIFRENPRFGVSAHFSTNSLNYSKDVGVYTEKNYEVYCTPVGDGSMNLNLLSNKSNLSTIRRSRSLEKLFINLLNHMEIDAVQTDEIIGSGPLGHKLNKSINGRLLFIGDSLQSLDPVGGMGMTHAILSAESAAEYLINEFNSVKNSHSYQFKIKVKTSPAINATIVSSLLIKQVSRSFFIKPLIASGIINWAESYLFNKKN
jgi:menaquinone-9 beta-reductase